MSDINWNNVVSAVATEDGLLVTERGVDGTVGATPRLMPYQTSYSGRQTNAGTQPTPPELPPPPGKDPFGSETKMTCTDAALKTYRFIINNRYFASFKACSDQDAWAVIVPLPGMNIKLQRLEAKPGYVSQWMNVPLPMLG